MRISGFYGLTAALVLAVFLSSANAGSRHHDHPDIVTSLPTVAASTLKHERHYAGYLSNGDAFNSSLFYWMTEARFVSQDSAPVVIWFNGGPGCSSIVGALAEVGPYRIHATDGKRPWRLIRHEYCWCNYANLIVIDQPIGVGFSYVHKNVKDSDESSSEVYATNIAEVARRLYHSIYILLTERHPHLIGRDVFFAGESYAAKYITALATHTENNNDCIRDPKSYRRQDYSHLQEPNDGNVMERLTVNCHSTSLYTQIIDLKGIMIGNGIYDPAIQRFAFRAQSLSSGLMDIKQANQYVALEQRCMSALRSQHVNAAAQACAKLNKFIKVVSGAVQTGDIRHYTATFPKKLIIDFMNDNDVRHALNVDPKMPPLENECNTLVHQALSRDVMRSTRILLPYILERMQVTVYSGNFDLKDGTWGNEIMLDSLLEWKDRNNYFISERLIWHPLMELQENKIAQDYAPLNQYSGNNASAGDIADQPVSGSSVFGYAKTYGNLQFVVVTQAGHMVASTQPVKAHELVYRVINGLSFCQTKLDDDSCEHIGPAVCELLQCGRGGHGVCDENRALCVCDDGWSGIDCTSAFTDISVELRITQHGETKHVTHIDKGRLQQQQSVYYYFRLDRQTLPADIIQPPSEYTQRTGHGPECTLKQALTLSVRVAEVSTAGQLSLRQLFTSRREDDLQLISAFLADFDRSDTYFSENSNNHQSATAPLQLAQDASLADVHFIYLPLSVCGHYAIKLTNIGTQSAPYRIRVRINDHQKNVKIKAPADDDTFEVDGVDDENDDEVLDMLLMDDTRHNTMLSSSSSWISFVWTLLIIVVFIAAVAVGSFYANILHRRLFSYSQYMPIPSQ